MPWNLTADLFLTIFIDSCLIVLILFSPLIYGSVTIFPLSVIEIIIFLVFFIFLLKSLLKKDSFLIKIPGLGLVLFILLSLLQLIPLPEPLLSFFSPAALDLYRQFRVGNIGTLTLSIYPGLTFNLFLEILSFLAVFLVVLNYADSEKKITRLITFIVISGFAYSLYGIAQKLYMDNISFSTFTNRNHFSAYVQMIIPLAIGYSLTRIPKSIKSIFIFSASVMILALFLSASRAGRVCFCLNIIFFFILLKIKKPMKNALFMIIILFVFLSIFIWFVGYAALTTRLETLLSPFKAYSDRFYTMVDSFKVVKDFPLFGTGLGTFGEIFQKYKTFNDQTTWSFSHNEPVQLLVEMGILGFLSVLFFLVRYFLKVFSVWRKRNSAFSVYITLGCFVGLISIISHSFFDFVFHVPANAILFFVILAVALRVVYLKEPQNLLLIPKLDLNLSRPLRISLILVSAILLVFLESLVWRRFQAEAIFEKIQDKKIESSGVEAILDYRKTLKSIDKAVALNPSNSIYLNKKAFILSELASREDLRNDLYTLKEFKGQKELLGLAEDLYKKAINLNPTKADYHLRLGWLYFTLESRDLAEKEFKNSLLLDPQNEVIKSYIAEYSNTAK